jgi:cell wall-associated NlpC family hydrolase
VAGSAARSRTGTTVVRRIALLVGAFGLVLGGAGTAAAAPAPASPGDIEAQIDQTWNKLEPLLEQWNGVHDKLVANQAKVAQLQNQIKPLKLQVDLAQARVGALSAKYYEYGPGSKLNALLVSGSPTTLVEQLNVLDEVARNETASVADVAKLRAQYEEQEKPIDALVAQLAQQQSMLDAQKVDLNNQLQQLQQLRLAAYGNAGTGTGSLRPVTCPQVYNGDAGSKAAKFACEQIGKKYVWAAEGPNSYDCSGLTLAAWRSVGVSLPHNAYEQKQVTPRISYANLRPGDLVFYYSDVHHVVIYVGNGWVVSAPTFGEPVQMQKIDMGRVNSYGRPG